jgi:two-component sensor histidine kinase
VCPFAQLYVWLPPEIDASACCIVAEALTNVVKHSQGDERGGEGSRRRRDAERGGPRRRRSAARIPKATGCWASAIVSRLGGRLRLDSRSGEGTVLMAVLPPPSSSLG